MAVITLPGTPDLLALHASRPERYPYLLQTLGAYGWDILFAFPQHVSQFPLSDLQGSGTGVFSALAEAWQHEGNTTSAPEAELLPFHGGWFVYLGYELLHELEPRVTCHPAPMCFPLACIARVPAAIMVNHAENTTHFFAENTHQDHLATMRADLQGCVAFSAQSTAVEGLSEEPGERFLASVERVREYIQEGDVFQVNLSRGWQAKLAGDGNLSASLYANLRSRNPAPFSGLANFGECQIVCSSPERLVKVVGRHVETRPIAGTHPRSPIAAEDQQLRQALLAHPKERAEHIMLVDLERNDLGRICEPGSIRVNELMEVHTYAYVHHIESRVSGQLRQGITPDQVLAALFPGGTITGCPKVRTMQIISELEQAPRLAYTGSMGYLNRDGSMDLNILIRSFMLTGNQLNFRAGAGIVADSDPVRELNETRAKAKGLLKALGVEP